MRRYLVPATSLVAGAALLTGCASPEKAVESAQLSSDAPTAMQVVEVSKLPYRQRAEALNGWIAQNPGRLMRVISGVLSNDAPIQTTRIQVLSDAGTNTSQHCDFIDSIATPEYPGPNSYDANALPNWEAAHPDRKIFTVAPLYFNGIAAGTIACSRTISG